MNIKHSILFLLVIVLFSCNENLTDQGTINNYQEKVGSISGNFKLYNIFNEEIKNKEGIKVELLQSGVPFKNLITDSEGKFLFDSLFQGSYTLVINKEGYECFDTIDFYCNPEINTFDTITLLEHLPSEIELIALNSMFDNLYWDYKVHYNSEKWLVIGAWLYFSKTPDVTWQNYDYRFISGSYTGGNNESNNVYAINKDLSSLRFAENGFVSGEKIYVIMQPIHRLFFEKALNSEINKNTDIERIVHIRRNASNMTSFIL